MKFIKVEGKNVCDIKMFALSTCGWCKKTKQYLKDLGLEFYYIDIDSLEGSDRDDAEEELAKWYPSLSFPTIVVNNTDCIVGFQPEKILELKQKNSK